MHSCICWLLIDYTTDTSQLELFLLPAAGQELGLRCCCSCSDTSCQARFQDQKAAGWSARASSYSLPHNSQACTCLRGDIHHLPFGMLMCMQLNLGTVRKPAPSADAPAAADAGNKTMSEDALADKDDKPESVESAKQVCNFIFDVQHSAFCAQSSSASMTPAACFTRRRQRRL